MINTELKNILINKVKYIDSYKINIEIWQDENEEYFNQVTLFNNDTEENDPIAFYENKNSKEECLKEAKKIKTYLQKHFENVNITEVEI